MSDTPAQPAPRIPRKKADKSSWAVSLVVHALVIGVIFFWAVKNDMLPPGLREMVAVLIPPKKEEKKPEPPKQIKEEPPPDQLTESVEPPPDSAAPLTAVAADPNAPATGNASPFYAEERKPGTPKAPLIQGQSGGPPVVQQPKPAPPSGRTTTLQATKPSTVERILEARAKSAAVSDAVGADQIAKSGGSDAGEIVGKVTGTSVVEGKYVVVRGLSDRYTTTTLNGGEVPTADPYRKSVQLDLIPSAMIDSIIVTKTLTPDQPGGFTGGAINVVTKSFPSKFTFGFSGGVSYNSQASLNENFLGYPGGETDWLGMDDGSRDYPASLDNGIPKAPAPGSIARNPTSAPARLALRTLELERRAQADALIAATKTFDDTTFAATREKSPLNRNFSAYVGDTLLFMGKPMGFLAGMSYNRDFSFYENGISSRYSTLLAPTKDLSDTRAIESVAWGVVGNLAYKPFPDHEVSVNFVFNQNSEDESRHLEGIDFTTGNFDPTIPRSANTLLVQDSLHFTERSLQTVQFTGKSFFPSLLDMRVNWLVSVATTTQDEPDLRYFNYYRTSNGKGGFVNSLFEKSLPEPNEPTRYFRNLKEDNFNFKADDCIPFLSWTGDEAELKFGLYRSESERTFNEKIFFYEGKPGFENALSPNDYLDDEFVKYLATPRRTANLQTNYTFLRTIGTKTSQNYTGKQDIQAEYLMVDTPIAPYLRAVGGVRLEATDLQLRGNTNSPVTTPLSEDDFLPSGGLIWSPKTNLNFRVGFGQSIARPAYREIANYRSYDTTGDEILEGNPNLRMSHIDNYDARVEFFPRPGEVLSISAFYKDLQDPIEKYLLNNDGGIITYTNRPSAIIYGVEFELRKALDFLDPQLRDFTFGMNAAYIQSKVELTRTELFNKRQVKGRAVEETRPLYDQSPFLINLDLTYSNASSGTTATLQAGLAGERIYIVNPSAPDIYEEPPPSLDFILSQRLWRHWRFKFTAKNILDPSFNRTYGGDTKLLYSSHTKGRTFGMSLAYSY